jgi:hypothetical protein
MMRVKMYLVVTGVGLLGRAAIIGSRSKLRHSSRISSSSRCVSEGRVYLQSQLVGSKNMRSSLFARAKLGICSAPADNCRALLAVVRHHKGCMLLG